jgi:hypothetical protein
MEPLKWIPNPVVMEQDRAELRKAIFDLVTEEWPGVAEAARYAAVDHALSLDTIEHYTQAMIWLDKYVYQK